MTALSKFFYDHLRTTTCQTFPLHAESCPKHLLKDLPEYVLSNFKYFAPICLLPALIKIQSMNKENLYETLKYYLIGAVTGTAVGFAVNLNICLFRNLFGKFLYAFGFLSAALAGYITYLSDPRIINLFETAIFQSAVETFFLMRRNAVSRSIANSRILQTLVFMFASAIILHGKQLYGTKGFWIVTPNPQVPQIENIESQKCQLHTESSCNKYLFEGMRKYFILGLSLDVIKALMGRVNPAPNQSKFIAKLKHFRMGSVILLTTYIGIYRFASCQLKKRLNNSRDTLSHQIASYLAGFSYYFFPQSTLFAYALVQAIQTIWTIVQISNADTKNNILKKLLGFPYAKILFPLGLGNMAHLLVFKPKYVSNFASAVGNGLSNNYPNKVHNTIVLILQEKLKNDAIKLQQI